MLLSHLLHKCCLTRSNQAAKHAIAHAEAQVAAAKAEMEAAIARFNALEKGLQAARQDVLRHHEEVAAARKKNEAAAAEEKRKKDEQVVHLNIQKLI